jgi:hypothetical protein
MSEISVVENSTDELIESKTPDWKTKALIIGAVAGALVGLGATYLFIQNVEDNSQPPEFTAGKGLKIGLLLMSLIRNIADLA